MDSTRSKPLQPAPAWSHRLGLAGLVVLTVGMLWAAAHFKNVDGTAFNPLHNFVSELGSAKSSAAAIFNRSLLISGPMIFAMVFTLGIRLRTRLGVAAIVTGFGALAGLIGVGLESMDSLIPHLIAALCYFWGWLATALLFTIACWRRHHSIVFASLGTLAATGAFLAVLTHALLGFVKMTSHEITAFRRPIFWDIAILEWCVVLSFFAWALTVIVHLRRDQLTPA